MSKPSPKQRFLSDPSNVKYHRAMVDGDAFQRGCDAAVLEYTGMVTQQIRDQASAMAAGLKIEGALEVLQTLRLLAEPPAARPTIVSDNLPGN